MEFNVIKEVNIENCENMYALSINYLKNHECKELHDLLLSLNKIETEIRKSKNLNELSFSLTELKKVTDRIEEIIHE